MTSGRLSIIVTGARSPLDETAHYRAKALRSASQGK